MISRIALASILISAASLLLSITVALTSRRCNLHEIQAMLLYEDEQPKVFFRAMPYATGKRPLGGSAPDAEVVL